MRASHSNKHIREAIRYAESKNWSVLQRQVLEHTSGAHYGVRNTPAMGVALESCQRHAIRNYMRATFVGMLTVVPMSKERNYPRK